MMPGEKHANCDWPALHRRVSRRASSVECDVRLYRMGREARRARRLQFLERGILAMARPEARARRVHSLRHLEPDRSWHDPRCHGGGRGCKTIRARRLATGALAARCRAWRPADGLGSPHWLWL